MTKSVGFIGLGTMGSVVAANVRRAGFSLCVHDLKRDKAVALEASGARWLETPAAVMSECDIVVTMVFGPLQLEQVVCGQEGLLSGETQGRGWIDLTTSTPALARRLANQVSAAGGWAIDAPVTGSVDAAIRGDMILFVGGQEDAVCRAMPVLQAMGEARRVGTNGTGQVAKLTNNLLWKINAAAIGEALVAAKKAGLDPAVWWRAMQGGAADSFVLRHDVPSIFAGHYDPSFPLALCLKDWGLIEALLQETNTPNNIATVAHARFKLAAERYGEQAGEMTVCKLLEEEAGVDLRVAGDWIPPWQVQHPEDAEPAS